MAEPPEAAAFTAGADKGRRMRHRLEAHAAIVLSGTWQ
jgi:hypothetical protein